MTSNNVTPAYPWTRKRWREHLSVPGRSFGNARSAFEFPAGNRRNAWSNPPKDDALSRRSIPREREGNGTPGRSKGSKTEMNGGIFQEGREEKYPGGTSDATTASSLTVPLFVMSFDDFSFAKTAIFVINAGPTDGRTDTTSYRCVVASKKNSRRSP